MELVDKIPEPWFWFNYNLMNVNCLIGEKGERNGGLRERSPARNNQCMEYGRDGRDRGSKGEFVKGG